jgi:glycosyltransferase involved in cell wall biosynthesis
METHYQISVVVPTYNRAPTLLRAIESILAQTRPVYEIIVVDDGSTDDTKTVIETFLGSRTTAEIPILYVHQNQQGASVARNTGMAQATGKWISFLDSDDRWLPSKIEWQIRAIETFRPRQPGLCFTDAVYFSNQPWNLTVFQRAGKFYKKEIEAIADSCVYVAVGNHPIHIQTVLIQKDIALQIGGFDQGLRIYEDNDFVFRAALKTGFCLVNKPLVEVDRSPGRAEGLTELFAIEDFRLQQTEHQHEKWLEMEIPPFVRKLVRAQMQHIYAGWSSLHLMRGDTQKALRAIRTSLRFKVGYRPVVKWALIRCFPTATRRVVIRRYEKSRRSMLLGLLGGAQ